MTLLTVQGGLDGNRQLALDTVDIRLHLVQVFLTELLHSIVRLRVNLRHKQNDILTLVDNEGYSPKLSRRICEYVYRSLMNMQSIEIATVIKMAYCFASKLAHKVVIVVPQGDRKRKMLLDRCY